MACSSVMILGGGLGYTLGFLSPFLLIGFIIYIIAKK